MTKKKDAEKTTSLHPGYGWLATGASAPLPARRRLGGVGLDGFLTIQLLSFTPFRSGDTVLHLGGGASAV